MGKNKKRTLRQAKADMDLRVQDLRGVIERGEQAAERLPLVVAQFDATQSYASNHYYECDGRNKGEPTLDDLESEIGLLSKDIECADAARAELAKAERFYRAYHIVVNGPKIIELQHQIHDAEIWQAHWCRKMQSVATEYPDEDQQLCESSHAEIEYNKACQQVQVLKQRLTELRIVR